MGLSKGIAGLKIKQKIPFLVYAGINFTPEKKVRLQTITTPSGATGPLFANYPNGLVEAQNIIERYLEGMGYTKGLEISILAEHERWRGFSFTGVISSLVAMAAAIVTDRIDAKAFGQDYASFIQSPIFNEVYELSLAISQGLSNGNSIGSTNYTVLLEWAHPFVCFPWSSWDQINTAAPLDEKITHILPKPIAEFFHLPQASERHLPIDYGVIFTGQSFSFSEILARQRRIQEDVSVSVFIREVLHKHGLDHLTQDPKTIFSNTQEAFHRNIAFLNTCLLKELHDLLKNDFDEAQAGRFIDTVNEFGVTSALYEREYELFSQIQYAFSRSRSFRSESIGLCPLNLSSAGGSFFFVTQYEKSRETVGLLMQELEKEWYQHATLEYASWRDGVASDGVHIQQYIQASIFSRHLPKDIVQFSDTSGNKVLWSYEDLLKQERNCLLLDAIATEISLGDTTFSSKEIPSKSTSIAIMSLLLEHIGEDILSSRFGLSSYTKNRNDMLGKIILPLQKAVENLTGQRLALSCNGGTSEFFLRLEKDQPIRIGLIQKIHVAKKH